MAYVDIIGRVCLGSCNRMGDDVKKLAQKPMSHRMLKALKSSINHWEDNLSAVSPSRIDIWHNSCALCKLYNNDFDETCGVCPVAARTGQNGCKNTPWLQASRALSNWEHRRSIANKERWREAALAQVNFLKSLLPKGEKP